MHRATPWLRRKRKEFTEEGNSSGKVNIITGKAMSRKRTMNNSIKKRNLFIPDHRAR